MIRSPLRCVLFDLDGTLVDTAPDLGGAANDLLAELGKPSVPLARYRPDTSRGARGLLHIALGITPDDGDYAHHFERFLTLYRKRLSRDSRPFPGITEVLQGIARAGLCWAVVTNKPLWLAEPLLQDLDLRPACASLVGGDSTEKRKPAPDPLLLACRHVGVEPAECVYVGDDVCDIEAGRAAHMGTIVAGWGYLGSDEDPARWGADALLTEPRELLTCLGLDDAA